MEEGGKELLFLTFKLALKLQIITFLQINPIVSLKFKEPTVQT